MFCVEINIYILQVIETMDIYIYICHVKATINLKINIYLIYRMTRICRYTDGLLLKKIPGILEILYPINRDIRQTRDTRYKKY